VITPSEIEKDAKVAVSWLKQHERIVLTALVLLFGAWIGGKWINARAANDDVQAKIALQQLDEQKAKDTQAAAQVTALTAQYQQLVITVSQENAALTALIKQRDTATQQQQVTDQHMTPPQLATRWATLVTAQPTDITATASGIEVTNTVALDTVEQLELVPTLQMDLKNEITMVDSKQQEVDSANVLNKSLTDQVTGLKSTVAADDVACKAEVASAKAGATKSKSKWFKIGFALGAATVWTLDHVKF
jgi:hypothetical protein